MPLAFAAGKVTRVAGGENMQFGFTRINGLHDAVARR